MTAPLEHPNCGVCAGKRRQREIDRGRACQTCGTSFVKPYPVESSEIAGYCNGCASVLHTRRPRGGRYGTTEPYREPFEPGGAE